MMSFLTLVSIQGLIERAILKATESEESLWLSALLILQNDSEIISRKYVKGELQFAVAKTKLLDLKQQTEILSSAPPDKESTSQNEEIRLEEQDYYQVLGIRRDASIEQIKTIYKKLAFIYHPDTGNFLGVDGDHKFIKYQEAFETLSDPVKRKEYDSKIVN